MSTIANITLKDSANAAKTYVPEAVQTGSRASWVNREQGTSVGVKRAIVTVPKKQGKNDRYNGRITIPVVNATTGELDFANYFNFEVQFHERATLAQKQELMNSAAAMLGLAPVYTLCTTGESISG